MNVPLNLEEHRKVIAALSNARSWFASRLSFADHRQVRCVAKGVHERHVMLADMHQFRAAAKWTPWRAGKRPSNTGSMKCCGDGDVAHLLKRFDAHLKHKGVQWLNGAIAVPGSCYGQAGVIERGSFFRTLEEERDCCSCGGSGEVACRSCGGSGSVSCFWCNGRGWVDETETDSDGNLQTVQRMCMSCSVGSVTCSSCDRGLVVCSTCSGTTYIHRLCSFIAEDTVFAGIACEDDFPRAWETVVPHLPYERLPEMIQADDWKRHTLEFDGRSYVFDGARGFLDICEVEIGLHNSEAPQAAFLVGPDFEFVPSTALELALDRCDFIAARRELPAILRLLHPFKSEARDQFARFYDRFRNAKSVQRAMSHVALTPAQQVAETLVDEAVKTAREADFLVLCRGINTRMRILSTRRLFGWMLLGLLVSFIAAWCCNLASSWEGPPVLMPVWMAIALVVILANQDGLCRTPVAKKWKVVDGTWKPFLSCTWVSAAATWWASWFVAQPPTYPLLASFARWLG